MPHFLGSLRKGPNSMGNWTHPHHPGDMVWVKKEPLKPSWMGPHLVILITPRTVKVAGITP
jgi:hypothetical protein